MQNILGANGQIAEELTRELYRNFTKNIRLVSRNPKKIHQDYQTQYSSFSGRVQTAINNIEYSICFDRIDFTETETEFIFNGGTIRFGYYDSEFD